MVFISLNLKIFRQLKANAINNLLPAIVVLDPLGALQINERPVSVCVIFTAKDVVLLGYSFPRSASNVMTDLQFSSPGLTMRCTTEYFGTKSPESFHI